MTVSASDVLREKTGICWAKANLLRPAQSLRHPGGICYQRLTLEDTPGSGYCHPCPECGFSAGSGQVDQT